MRSADTFSALTAESGVMAKDEPATRAWKDRLLPSTCLGPQDMGEASGKCSPIVVFNLTSKFVTIFFVYFEVNPRYFTQNNLLVKCG